MPIDVEVIHEGSAIKLPYVQQIPMGYREAIDTLTRKMEEDEKVIQINHSFECAPLDAAVCFVNVVTKKFGWIEQVRDNPMRPPQTIGVPTGPHAADVVQIPFGAIKVPGVDGTILIMIDGHPVPQFAVIGKVRKKHASIIGDIVRETKDEIRTRSIYRGKAIRIGFGYIREERPYDALVDAPKFMDLSGVAETDLIFGETVQQALNIGLFTPITHYEACRKLNIPLKRGILLHGQYGTGKTMTANVTALKAQAAGWTFIYLDDVRDLKAALRFAQQYAPAVVFAEDIDRAMTGDRSVSIDEILNTLDGIDSKGSELITVLTTNHIERINPAMLRMGRLDTLVEVLPPDAQAAARLVRLYSRGLLEDGASLDNIGKVLDGKIPAFIRETVERAKLAAVMRVGGSAISGRVLEVDLLNAAKAMESHDALLKPKKAEAALTPLVFLPADGKTQHRVNDVLQKHAGDVRLAAVNGN
jgi:transitional endoplasmic reticulum ATPase